MKQHNMKFLICKICQLSTVYVENNRQTPPMLQQSADLLQDETADRKRISHT